MEIFIIYITGFFCGWYIYGFFLRKRLLEIAREHGIKLDDEEEVTVIKVPKLFTEKLDNVILCYSKETGAFMSQASSMEELADNILRHKNINVALVYHEDTQLWFVEGKVKAELQ